MEFTPYTVQYFISPAISIVMLAILLRYRRLAPAMTLVLIGLALESMTGIAHWAVLSSSLFGNDPLSYQSVTSSQFIRVLYRGITLVGLAARVSLMLGLCLVIRYLNSRLNENLR
jgi:hypothetical protein